MHENLILVENFEGMRFLNSPQINEDEYVLKFESERVTPYAIGIFMTFIAVTLIAIAYFLGGLKSTVAIIAAVLMIAFFVIILWFCENVLKGQLPYVNKLRNQLILASGTSISKDDILCFRQYRCRTEISNFNVVLTTVVTKELGCELEYAVLPVIGKMKQEKTGLALANFFDRKLLQDTQRTFTTSQLTELGIN